MLAGTPSAEPEDAPRPPDEYEKVLSYRELMFRDVLGFNEWQAVSLAESDVDWHDAKRILDRGCTHELALDILLP